MVEKILDKEIEEKVLKADHQLSWISGIRDVVPVRPWGLY